MTYGVIVCTRCRKQAQIIEIGNSKTTRCQRCNSKLMARKLRVFFSSDSLDETISVRAQIQAQIVKNGAAMSLHEEEEGFATQHRVFGEEVDMNTAVLIDKRKKKKKADEVILEILLSNNGQMSHDELKKATVFREIEEEKFEEVLKKMLEAGKIYSPSGKLLKTI